MYIVLLVTRIAVLRENDLRDVLRDVAGVTVKVAVGARQREVRLRVVIKAPEPPRIRIVAERAIGPQASFVMFVPVTGRARQARVPEPP